MSTMIVNGKEVEVTHLDKVMFPKVGINKAELINYYIQYAKYILPWLKDRPFTMVPYPHGVEGKHFYQKRQPEKAPDYLRSVTLPSDSEKGDIAWSLVNDLPSIVYMANRACIEMHAWFSRVPHLLEPDVAIFDLDPSGNTGYEDAVAAAKLIHIILDDMGVKAFPKTSGATGLHVVIPIEPTPYEKVREFLTAVCKLVVQADPEHFTIERTIKKRGDKVYLDAVQNAKGKTIPSPYSVRATDDATVSTPITWQELERGIDPKLFTLQTMDQRMKDVGDLFEPVYTMRQKLPDVDSFLH